MSGKCPLKTSPQWGVERGVQDVNTGNDASGRHMYRKPETTHYGPRPNAGGQSYTSTQYRQPHPDVMMEWGRGALPSSQSYGINPYSGNGRGREPRNRSQSGDRKRQQSRSAERANANYSSNSSFDNSFSPQNYGRKQEHDDITFLSRTLSSILRHTAENFRLKLMPGGFIYVDEILHKVEKLYGYTIDDVKYVVESNDKQQFTLVADDKGLKIRANQGHTMEVEDLDLKPITSADNYPTVIHGTYMEAWEKIKKTGLNRMKRNHIHFAPGTPGANGVISGIRSSCEVMIYLDLEKALKDGLKFFVSSNNVILSPGDANGVIHPRYFVGAVDRYYGYRLEFDPEIDTKPGIQNKNKGQSSKGKRKQEREDKRGKGDNEQGEISSADKNPPSKTHASKETPSTSQCQVEGTSVDKVISEEPAHPPVSGSNVVDELEPPVEESGSKRPKLEEKTPSMDEPCESEALKTIRDYGEGEFIYVDEILHKVKKLYGYTIEDVVESNDKQCFTLVADDKGLKIKVNQGHTMEVEDLDLKPITSADDYPTVIHGTYMDAWEKIKKTGLNRMKRNHIHFAPGTPGANGVISGMRSSCEVMIYLDLEKALKDGLKFFVSSNNVILSPGDANGVIHPRYFVGAVDRYYGSRLPFDPEIVTNPGKQNKDKGRSNTGKRKQEKNDKTVEERNVLGEILSTDRSQGQVQGKRVDKVILGDFPDPLVCGNDAVDKMEQPVEEAGSKRPKLEEKIPFKEQCDWEALKSIQDYSEGRDAASEEGVSMEPVMIEDPEISKFTVNELIADKPDFVVVIYCGENLGEENGHLHQVAVGTRKELYVFNLDKNTTLMNDGQLKELLMNKEITKVFCGIQAISSSLIMEYDILMNGIPIWDIEILHDKLSGQMSEIDKDTIKEMGFHKKYFKKWAKKSDQPWTFSEEDMMELKQQAAIMIKMYTIFQKQNFTEMSGTQCIKKTDEDVPERVPFFFFDLKLFT